VKKEKTKNVTLEPIAEADRVPLKEKLAYGIGGLMDGGGVSMMSCVMVAFMEHNGIALGLATTIFMIAKLWDAITDPFMGFISDNTRGKWGRRKPYMFWGGISLLLCIFLVFLPVREWGMSVGGFTAYIILMYLLWNTCSTVTQVPYCSMASDITPSFRERNNANTVKLVFTAIASGLGYVLPLLFIEALKTDKANWLFMPKIDGVQFWLLMSIIFGVLFGGGLVICGLFVKERINPKTPKRHFNFKQFVNSYAVPYKNRSYRWHIAMYVSAFACMDMISALAVYYATDVWKGYKLFGMDMSSLFIIAPLMVAAVVMFPLARVMMDKKSKQFAFRMGLPFYIGGGIMLAIMDPSWAPPILVPIVALIMGLGFGGAQMMPWIIFPDTVDVAEMATGQRPTGTYSGMMTLARKVGGALAVGFVGWVIDPFYLPKDQLGPDGMQPQEALLAIRLVLGITVAVLITIALISSFRYKVTSAKLTRIRYFIEARKSGKTLTDEESVEREALVAELYGKVNPDDVVDPSMVDDEGNLIESAPETDIVEGVEDAIEEIAVTDDEIAQNEVVDVENDDKTTVLPNED
jgi:Na+/melibiose symporter and related transporters